MTQNPLTATPCGTLSPTSSLPALKPMSLPRLSERHADGEKIAMFTAYDTIFAAANGLRRSQATAWLIDDLPLGTYQECKVQALRSAVLLMQSGAHMIKLMGGGWTTEVVHFLVERGIPVCVLPKLTPQTVHALDGSRVQGKADQAAATLKREVGALQDAGVAMLVLVVTYAAMLKLSKKELLEVTQAEAFAAHLRATGLHARLGYVPHGRALRVAACICQRKTRRLFALSKPAQAGLQPQRSAPRKTLSCGLAKPVPRRDVAPTVAHFVSLPAPRGGRCACGLAKPVPRPLLFLRPASHCLALQSGN